MSLYHWALRSVTTMLVISIVLPVNKVHRLICGHDAYIDELCTYFGSYCDAGKKKCFKGAIFPVTDGNFATVQNFYFIY